MCAFFIHQIVCTQAAQGRCASSHKRANCARKITMECARKTDSENICYHDFHCALLGGRFIKCCANQVNGGGAAVFSLNENKYNILILIKLKDVHLRLSTLRRAVRIYLSPVIFLFSAGDFMHGGGVTLRRAGVDRGYPSQGHPPDHFVA